MNIKKTQKRANALKNITIPQTETIIKTISDALEEKEREDFIRLKVIKREMNKKNEKSWIKKSCVIYWNGVIGQIINEGDNISVLY